MTGKPDKKYPYIIRRDYISSLRLNYNHWMLKTMAGYLLHPSIPTDSSDEMRIADIGTGTGIWATEIAVTLPNARIDGFDISADQAPPPHRTPRIKFHVHDCFEPFAPEFLGKFDVVHLKYWLCIIVNNPDAPRLLTNLQTLLKPGGHIQWSVLQGPMAQTFKPDGKMNTPAIDKLVEMQQKPKADGEYEWTGRLEQIYQDCGLDAVASHLIPMTDYYRPLWGTSLLAGMHDTIDELEFVGSERREGMAQLTSDVKKEFQMGAGMNIPNKCVVGRMPGTRSTKA